MSDYTLSLETLRQVPRYLSKALQAQLLKSEELRSGTSRNELGATSMTVFRLRTTEQASCMIPRSARTYSYFRLMSCTMSHVSGLRIVHPSTSKAMDPICRSLSDSCTISSAHRPIMSSGSGGGELLFPASIAASRKRRASYSTFVHDRYRPQTWGNDGGVCVAWPRRGEVH